VGAVVVVVVVMVEVAVAKSTFVSSVRTSTARTQQKSTDAPCA